MLKPDFRITMAFESDGDLPMTVHFCNSEQCKPGHTFGPAIRNIYVIHFITSGCGSYTVGDRTYKLSAGDGFILPPFVTTLYSADKTDPWEYSWIGFSGPAAETMLGKFEFTDGDFIIHSDNIATVKEIFDRAIECFSGENNIYSLLGYLYLIMAQFSKSNYKKNDTYARLVNYIARNYMKELTMEMLSNEVNLSHPQIYRLFKTHSKLSPAEYIIAFRVARAQELLTNTNIGITDISFSCGFNSTAYFSKIFRLHTGSTPTQYRRKAKQNFMSTQM